MSSLFKIVSVACLAALASVVFFSPRLLVFTAEAPGSYEWTRGLNFLAQVEGQPIERVEPALRHRLLPVLAARALGLTGYAGFALGWMGVVVLLACVYSLMSQSGVPGAVATSTAFLFASTSAVITSFGWLGIFDSWWVLALIVVAMSPKLWPVAVAGLAGPWIDERFIIGLPLAFLARWLVYQWQPRIAGKLVLVLATTIAPYAAWRVYSLLHSSGDASQEFLSLHFLVWLRMVPHGWWMAYRLAWACVIFCFVLRNASGVRAWQLGVVCLLVAAAAIVTAADISRSAMVIAPLVPAGVLLAWRQNSEQTKRWLPWIAAANFATPYIHVVYIKLEPVHPLPWEILRLARELMAGAHLGY
jgi:hypothetical protein